MASSYGGLMTTKLKIDLTQGILEVEGSETFVKAIYRDFKTQFLGEEAVEEEKSNSTRPKRRRKTKSTKAKATPPAQPEKVDELAPPDQKPESPPSPDGPLEAPAPARKRPSQTYTYMEDLELKATADHLSLVEFMDSKLPITNEERNLVFLYYLQYIIKHKPIKLDDIYTCYVTGKIRVPLNIEQSLQKTADSVNWIKITKNGNMTVTAEGKRYVEEQLPKKVKG
jgi:hypothetical protein